MKILGIHNHKDSVASLIVDGIIKCVANEERFNKKN